MRGLNIPLIKEVYNNKGFPYWTGPNNVNIGAIRSDDTKVNEFNDILFFTYEDDFGRENLITHKGTTKPGLYWLKNKLGNMNGTAILKEGYYSQCWELGLHKGQYEALIQSDLAKFIVYRDNDADGELDYTGELFFDVTGLNGHTTSFKNEIERVGAYSAGCQVRQDELDHLMFMAIVKKSMEKYGPYVSYGLTNMKDFF